MVPARDAKCFLKSSNIFRNRQFIPVIPSQRLGQMHFRLMSSNSDIDQSVKSSEKLPAIETKVEMKGVAKGLVKKYGAIGVATYLSIYVSTLGFIFTSLEYDFFNAATFGLDPAELIKKVCSLIENNTGNQSIPNYIRTNPTVGTFAIAWVMTKFTEPVRLGVTLFVLPKIARLMGKT